MNIKINEEEIKKIEKLLLPEKCIFSEDAKEVLKCFESKEILACPGSGKTTLLLGKIKLLADRMPFKNGSGICVLSHTNVAVDEIKCKLGEEAQRILDYPNFVGTIQSFIDHYVVFPYLCGITKTSIQVVDDENFAQAFWNKCKSGKYSKIKWMIQNGCKIHSQFESPVDFIKNFKMLNGDLYVQGVKTKKAGENTDSVKQYNNIIRELLINDGLIRYKDAYSYTEQALEVYGDILKPLLSERFKFIFVDEYQDCSQQQRDVVERLFDESLVVIQKIGDVDQAIYNSDLDNDNKWIISPNSIFLLGTNRYGQEIANILVKLRTNNEPILAFRGKREIAPTLIIFNENTQGKVVETFVNEIVKNGLDKSFPEGPFKAIGMYKNVTGLKIGDYWEGYQNKANTENSIHFCDFIQSICLELEKGKLYKAELIIRKLLCKICYYSGIFSTELNEDGSNKNFSLLSMKKELNESKEFDYREKILGLTQLENNDYIAVKQYVEELITLIIDKKNIKVPKEFWEMSDVTEQKNTANTFESNSGICVDFETVYKVKGETHIATLYLETEKSRGTDVKRIMPLLENKKAKTWTEIHEKSRRCVYVGLSRPSHLLCMAIRESTYKTHERAFKEWKIIDLGE